MNCTTTTHIWLWFGAGTGSACDDHVRCQCGAYTYGEWHSLRDQNARLQALLAERDAEVARLRDAGDALAEAVEHEANERTRSGRVIWQRGYDALAVWSAARAALAARGGEVRDGE